MILTSVLTQVRGAHRGVGLHLVWRSDRQDLPEVKQLIADLDETRWTGRPGYPIRVMVGAALVKAVYALPTWTRRT